MRKQITEKFYRIGAFMIVLMFLVLVFSIVRSSLLGQVDPEKHIYFEIVFLLLMAVLAEAAVFYFKQQSVVILMVFGIIVSPSFLSVLWNLLLALNLGIPTHPPEIIIHEEIINVFAQLGALILLFKVGMHSKIEKIFSKVNIIVASAGIIVPFGAGYLYASATGGDFASSMFIGVALAATSVGVTVAILRDLKVLNKKYSEIIIGAAVIDDILALLLLSVVMNLTGVSEGAFTSILGTFTTAVIFILGALLTGDYVIKYIDKKSMGPKRFLLTLAYMLLLSYVAEIIRLSAIVGAFLAGLILNRSKHYQVIEERTYGLELLFMPIFFISLGILVDVYAVAAYFLPILAITVIALLSKLLGCGLTALMEADKRESLIVGIGMAPRGEVALIIASIGLSRGILEVSTYSIISAMALLTSFIAPPILTKLIKAKF